MVADIAKAVIRYIPCLFHSIWERRITWPPKYHNDSCLFLPLTNQGLCCHLLLSPQNTLCHFNVFLVKFLYLSSGTNICIKIINFTEDSGTNIRAFCYSVIILIALVLLSFLSSCFVCKNLSSIGQPPEEFSCKWRGDGTDGSSSTLSRVSGVEAWLKWSSK